MVAGISKKWIHVHYKSIRRGYIRVEIGFEINAGICRHILGNSGGDVHPKLV